LRCDSTQACMVAAMAATMHAWVESQRKKGRLQGILAPCGARSNTVTVVKTRDGTDARDVVEKVGARGFTLGPGYGKLAATTFRVGHMGDHTVETLSRLLDVVGEVLGEG